jgi:hypothetical protein
MPLLSSLQHLDISTSRMLRSGEEHVNKLLTNGWKEINSSDLNQVQKLIHGHWNLNAFQSQTLGLQSQGANPSIEVMKFVLKEFGNCQAFALNVIKEDVAYTFKLFFNPLEFFRENEFEEGHFSMKDEGDGVISMKMGRVGINAADDEVKARLDHIAKFIIENNCDEVCRSVEKRVGEISELELKRQFLPGINPRDTGKYLFQFVIQGRVGFQIFLYIETDGIRNVFIELVRPQRLEGGAPSRLGVGAAHLASVSSDAMTHGTLKKDVLENAVRSICSTVQTLKNVVTEPIRRRG